MFYRRKILLAILERFGKVSKTSLQKYLFLFVMEQIKRTSKPVYQFVPYQYGCYSFTSAFDLNVLEKYGNIKIEDGVEKSDNYSYIENITKQDREILDYIFYKHRNRSLDDLIGYVYKEYPYYAQNSKIRNRYFSDDFIKSYVNRDDSVCLFSIGYEGISIETYINKLISNNVKLVCDVRKNAFSMKYGFSKTQLLSSLKNVNVGYIHIPELGIESDKRECLDAQSDYDKLFIDYRDNILINGGKYINELFDLLLDKRRIALTCFEKEPEKCHRTIVKNAITELDNFNILLYGVKDI